MTSFYDEDGVMFAIKLELEGWVYRVGWYFVEFDERGR